MVERAVKWIRSQVSSARAKGIVLGLSGGIDSAVVAALAKKALGANNVLALLMPCHSSKKDAQDARLVAKKLGIKTKTVDLSSIYDALLALLPKSNNLAKANLKPRLRMMTLYYFANSNNYLVCGTGNKSECKVGYFTKYGDGGVDILPIGGLFKTQVRALARELGIPERVIVKPPTAGLWPEQTDESEMGITYPELDDILSRMERRRKHIHSKEKVSKVALMLKRSAHKAEGPRICRF